MIRKRNKKSKQYLVKKKIHSTLAFNRFIYSILVLFMILLIYVASVLLIAISEDLNNAISHDKKLKDQYNERLERHNTYPDKYPEPAQPEYITFNVFLEDLPYLILSISIFVGIYIFILETFFWIFPPIYQNTGKHSFRIGGIVKIISYHDNPYIVVKSSYFSKPVLIDTSEIDLSKKVGTIFNFTMFVINHDKQLYANIDSYGNIVLSKHEYVREQVSLNDWDNILYNTLQKGVSRIKIASKSNHEVAVSKELVKEEDILVDGITEYMQTRFN